MNGVRVWPNFIGQLRLPDGGYGQGVQGEWRARPPGCNAEDLRSYQVTEHGDETITVKPVIRVSSFTGLLDHGIWQTL